MIKSNVTLAERERKGYSLEWKMKKQRRNEEKSGMREAER